MKRFFILVSIALLASCNNDKPIPEPEPVPEPEEVFLRSYVMSYYDIEGIKLYCPVRDMMDLIGGPPDGSDFPPNFLTLAVVKKTDMASYRDTDPARKALYDALCLKHGDMSYNRVVKPAEHFVEYPIADFVSIDIVSDADFNESHPAGTSLNDLIGISSLSAKPFIDSGYDPGYIAYYGYAYELTPVTPNGHLDTFPSDEMILMGRPHMAGGKYADVAYLALIYVGGRMTLSKTHTFTVTMTADDGRVFTDSIEMTFE